MKLKMKFEIKYIYNDNAVIAVAKPNIFDKNLDIATAQYMFLTGKEPNIKLPTEFKGVARYKKNDTYNLKLAEKIARKKALRLAYSTYGNYAYELFRTFKSWNSDFFQLVASAAAKAEELNNDIVDLVRE